MRLSGTWIRVLIAGAVLTVGTATVASAQAGGRGRGAAGRPTAAATLRRERIKDRLKNATPAQKAYIKALMAEHQKLRAEAKAGTIDRQSAAADLKAWRAANPPPKKATTTTP
jgi:hypothetical protein